MFYLQLQVPKIDRFYDFQEGSVRGCRLLSTYIEPTVRLLGSYQVVLPPNAFFPRMERECNQSDTL